ncbi:MAG: HAMP domain-containing histidine kinase [Paludibacteraceae bacterium]|nr:HAMP domain-containing histidine kinase [Paludibacteraceae bacterium]
MKHIPLVILSLLIVLGTVFYTNRLAASLAQEEQRKVEIWAEATRLLILAGPDDNIDFISTIIEGNTTIPVYMTDNEGRYMLSRNVKLPARLQKKGKDAEVKAFYQKQIDKLRETTEPIVISIQEGQNQYIYYDDSETLRRLQFLPYLQLLLIATFLIIAVFSLTAAHHAEENMVWVGLCKETAHQLGTPISSLVAWNELLRMRNPDEKAFEELEHDINRLKTITDRFSKIGSRPILSPEAVEPQLEQTINYMRHRISDKIQITSSCIAASDVRANINTPLFTWVIENLIKNSVDAMSGKGHINISLSETRRWSISGYQTWLCIDVTDTGKGIERRNFRKIFRAGYTTKQRGWGLGLSLAKRIINDYHYGKIFVLNSVPEKGTTIRILLKKAL